jgi:hypothetical protein
MEARRSRRFNMEKTSVSEFLTSRQEFDGEAA